MPASMRGLAAARWWTVGTAMVARSTWLHDVLDPFEDLPAVEGGDLPGLVEALIDQGDQLHVVQ